MSLSSSNVVCIRHLILTVFFELGPPSYDVVAKDEFTPAEARIVRITPAWQVLVVFPVLTCWFYGFMVDLIGSLLMTIEKGDKFTMRVARASRTACATFND